MVILGGWAFSYGRGTPVPARQLPETGLYPEAGLSIPRRAYLSRGGPIYPEAGLFIPRRAYLSRGGHIYPEAGQSIPRRAYAIPEAPHPPGGGRHPTGVPRS